MLFVQTLQEIRLIMHELLYVKVIHSPTPSLIFL